MPGSRIGLLSAVVGAAAASLLSPGCLRAGRAPHPQPFRDAVIRYALDVRLRPADRRMEVRVEARLPGRAAPWPHIPFVLRSDMEKVRVRVLAPRSCAGTATLERAGRASGLDRSTRWKARPPRPCPPREPVSLRIRYAGGRVPGFQFHLGTPGSFAGAPGTAWYPRFGRGRGVGTLRFTVPRGVVVKATGDALPHAPGAREATFRFQVRQPSLFNFAAARYLVRRAPGRISTTFYLLRDRPFTKRLLARSARALAVLEREFGPYPFREFAIIETPSPQSRKAGFLGASYEGFIFVDSRYLDVGLNLAYIGHEASHQWWGVLVRRKGREGKYLMDEALAQYGSLRVISEVEGAAAAARYRRVGYPGYLPLQSVRGAVLLAAAGLDRPLVKLPQDSISHQLADSKGLMLYHMLARTVGEERLRRALRAVTRRFAFASITWRRFTRTLEESCGRELGWFFDQWLNQTGVPRWGYRWKVAAGKLRIVIRQVGRSYRLDLPVEVESLGGRRVVHRIQLTRPEEAFVLPAPAGVRAVRLDPEYHVFHASKRLWEQALALRPWIRAWGLAVHRKHKEAIRAARRALARVSSPDEHGLASTLNVFLGYLFLRGRRLDAARRAFEAALANPHRRPAAVPTVYLALARIAQMRHDPARVRWAARQAEKAARALGGVEPLVRQAQRVLQLARRR